MRDHHQDRGIEGTGGVSQEDGTTRRGRLRDASIDADP
jgi:hypothetical protein